MTRLRVLGAKPGARDLQLELVMIGRFGCW